MFQDFIEIFILSLIQGVSEFLPISSSAHLIIVSTLYEFHSSSLLIDIGLHLGSLLAIIFFFKKELFDLKNNQRVLILIFFGSIPLIIVGYFLFKTGLIDLLRNIEIIAWMTLIFAIILFFADRSRFDKKNFI
jgi:undecaprenyl-diphosphatase